MTLPPAEQLDPDMSGVPKTGTGGDVTVSSHSTAIVSSPDLSPVEEMRLRRRLRRRGGRPPGWVIWVVQRAPRFKQMLIHQFPGFLAAHREQMTTAAVSLAFHLVIVLLMLLWVIPPDMSENLFLITSHPFEVDPDNAIPVEIEHLVQPEQLIDRDANSQMKRLVSDLEDGRTSSELDDIVEREFQLELDPTQSDLQKLFRKGEFGGRSTAGKRAAVKEFGGSEESERAVAAGLKWLANIQKADGSWSFDEVGQDADPGSMGTTDVGATSLALLCFLGAGHTHMQDSPYRDVVYKGLQYIGENADIQQGMADLTGNAQGRSQMYVQGIATICLCEAHAMERSDSDLEKLAEHAVNFIERAQHPVNGGWRYVPREDIGDTSVVGWQVMALQSAKSGGIRIDTRRMRLARDFMRSVAIDNGAFYSYLPGGGRSTSMTAVGLLCRMYLGWRKDNESLQKGVQHLSSLGPDRRDMYRNYYATQVLHHFGGDEWKKWNRQMRDQLVRTQIRQGPAAGSWRATDPHADAGGQIYQSALCILTLEVYYRHLPIYRRLQDSPTDSTATLDE